MQPDYKLRELICRDDRDKIFQSAWSQVVG